MGHVDRFLVTLYKTSITNEHELDVTNAMFGVVGQCLRPSSDDFPKLAVRHSPGPTRVRESERVVGETVTTKTEEYTDEETGLVRVRTVEIVEKVIEKEVLGQMSRTHTA